MSDTGIGILLACIALSVSLIARILGSDAVMKLAASIPRTIRKTLAQSGDPFKKLVCCPKCSSLYEVEKCIVMESKCLILVHL